jgi:endonuclease YncB( thermonuclease family)
MTQWRNLTKSRKWIIVVTAIILLFILLGSCGGNAEQTAQTVVPTVTTTAPEQTITVSPSAKKITVTRVVDGDTVVLSNGKKVRLIGIDTPEVGRCGYKAATSLMKSLVLNKAVVLTKGAQDNTDKYGRLLRYVNVGSTDAGMKMIQSGRAIARYDSRDGYGRHTRESAYIAADRASPSKNVCTASTPKPTSSSTVSVYYANCDAVRAAGADPLYKNDPGYSSKLDRDGDGVACE